MFKSLKQNLVKVLNWNKNSYWSVVWEKTFFVIFKSWQKKKQLQPSEAAAERCSLKLDFP